MNRRTPYHPSCPASAGDGGFEVVPAQAPGAPGLDRASAPSPASAAPVAPPAGRGGRVPSVARFKLEAIVLLLVLATIGAVQFQDLFISRKLDLSPTAGNHSIYETYTYDDSGNGGHSTIRADAAQPLHWWCDLKAGYAYPFCGYGLIFDSAGRGKGIDLSHFQDVAIRLDYRGSAKMLRLGFKNSDPRYKAAGAKPNELEVPVRQGPQTIALKLDDLTVASWWATQNHVPEALAGQQRDNVTAIEIQPGTGSGLGRHEFRIEAIDITGRQMSQAQFYLALLIGWAVLIGLLLVWRVVIIRRAFEARHQRDLAHKTELHAAKTVAEEASAAKSVFLRNMSHELRTPLNAIIGYAQLLEKEDLPEKQAAAVRTIHKSGAHLLTLITDLLDLARIEAGRLELQPAAFDLHALVEGVGEMMRMEATAKGLDFLCVLDGDIPRRLVGDDKRLRQVLINLVGNAIKFTHQGEVSLQVAALAPEPGKARMRIEVRDTGVGMSEGELLKVFEPFEQAGTAERRAAGTGLGLSITRQIVGLMGGRINVESSAGQGSRFWFDVALDLAEPMKAVAGPPLAAEAAATAAAREAGEDPMVPPPAEQLRALLKLAKAGNMRAIRAFAEDLGDGAPEYGPFAARLTMLAAAYQSRAILDLVEKHIDTKEAA